MASNMNKVAIIGCGSVGSTFAYALMLSGEAREIALIDVDRERARGESMDLNHGANFVRPVNISATGYEGCRGAEVVVITAGAKQKAGESRLDLVRRNTEIFKDIIPKVREHAKDAILLVVTNPVDILTYVTLKISGYPSEKVLGSGTVLDSSRLRYLVSDHAKVDARNVHAYIIGEHGDSELPVWSNATIGGMRMVEYCPMCNAHCDREKVLGGIFEEVKNAAYKIIETKGATYYAIGLALVKIVGAILRDENSVLPVSTLISGYYGVEDVCLSMPSLVNRSGVRKFLRLKLSGDEEVLFKKSAETLKDIIRQLKL